MDSKKIILYASCLMLEIAKTDNNVKNEELIIIEEILIDYFRISKKYASEILRASHKELENSIDIFEYANFLNHELDYEDKVDLIRCIFEVGYSDGKLHYLELHYIKIMSSLLNIENDDVVKAKLEKKN